MVPYFTQEFAVRQANNYNSRLTRSMAQISEAVQYEADQKTEMIVQSIAEELEPLTMIMLEEAERFARMYETNQYHVRDITDAAVASMEEVR